ncbi:MAG: hypothetical protein IPI18_16875 [Saprospiraceae bacterium]|nr:hypothetical protein [Saprospiraceae bacterium]
MSKIEILFEDDHLLVVNKPPVMLSIPDRWDANKDSLYHSLTAQYPDLLVVHRLDKDTSGVIVFAKNPEAHKILNNQFANSENFKSYLAVVNGIVFESGIIDTAIAADPFQAGKMVVHKKESLLLQNMKSLILSANFLYSESAYTPAGHTR